MSFPILFDTFVEKIKNEQEACATSLEDYQLRLCQEIDRVKGIDNGLDESLDTIMVVVAGAVATCREWSTKINSFNVIPRCRGEIEAEDIEKLIEECAKLHDLVEENVKSIAASRAMKRQSEIDLSERDAALTRQYIADGYKLKNETLETFALTYHGARLRLIEAGVWRMDK